MPHPAARAHLIAAIEANHRSWFACLARAAGAPIHRDQDLIACASTAADGEGHLPFPRLDTPRTGVQLDEVVAFFREHRPQGSVLAWAAGVPPDGDLGVRLMARGFRCSFQPHWMWLALDRLQDAHPAPPDLRTKVVEDTAIWEAHPHPFFGASGDDGWWAAIHAEARAAATLPQRTWHVVAWLDNRPVGASTVHLTTGADVIAGIYNVGVLEEYRNRGIGRAVTAAVCRLAGDQGARIAGLNATPLGEPVYHRLGFESLGSGQTWHMAADRLRTGPPAPAHVAFAEAIGFGDITALDNLAARLDAQTVATPLACGSTSIQLAARWGQPAAAEWLIACGGALDPLSAWDLSWHERIPAALAAHPGLLEAPCGVAGGTALHEAVFRNDPDLVRFLLTAGADSESRDATYHSTPLDWADHLGRPAIAALLRRSTNAGCSPD